jgi:hypothetical protein
MEWSTIPTELLEQVLLYSVSSPQAVASASQSCKNWHASSQDQHFWKNFYRCLRHPEPVNCIETKDQNIDWKKRTVDHFLVRNNVKKRRCVERTIAAMEEQPLGRTEINDHSFCKDYAIIHWAFVTTYIASRKGTVPSPTLSHLVNMVTGEFVELKDHKVSFSNNFISNARTERFHLTVAKEVVPRIQQFDPTMIKHLSFDEQNSVNFDVPEVYQGTRQQVTNYCSDSIFVGLFYYPSQILVMNATTGSLIYSSNYVTNCGEAQMYDNYLALHKQNTPDIEVIDVSTGEVIASHKFSSNISVGQMLATKIVLRTEDKVILWNFIDQTEVTFPSGQVPTEPLLIYNNMWLSAKQDKVSFYDMSDGSLMHTLNFPRSYLSLNDIMLLSNGCLGIVSASGCKVISFMDSEINQSIKLELLDTDGNVTFHDIVACNLPQFYVDNIDGLNTMTSCIVQYAATESDEHYVMIYSTEKPSRTVNVTATKLVETARKPRCMNSPYAKPYGDRMGRIGRQKVCGKVIIVKEKKLDGRWQLVGI